MRSKRLRNLGLVLLVCYILASCGISVEPRNPDVPVAAPAPTVVPSGRPLEQGAAPPPNSSPAVSGLQFFVVDKLVRATDLDGIDLHLRYVERTAHALVLHLSFYNNRAEDLAYVSGSDLSAARLVGTRTYEPSAHSPSLDTGIDPEGGWLAGGATVGSLTFAGAHGAAFQLLIPGFPELSFRLDQPVAEAPVGPRPPEGVYTYDVEVRSPRLENIVLRVNEVRVEHDALLLQVAFVNMNPSDITFSSTITGHDAVIFDGLWQQYRPAQVEQTLDQGIQPVGDVWGEGEPNTGTLTFPRPVVGDVLLLRFPSYPLVRLPLRAGAEAGIASEADLPPTVVPRPTPTPTPSPTPLSGDELARHEVHEVIEALGRALASGDREQYLAQFAPALRAAQGEVFDRVAVLPITALTLEVGDDEQNGLPNGENEIRGVAAELSYSVREAKPVFTSSLEYTLRREGGIASGRWLVSEVGGQLPFWVYGKTAAKRSGAFWIFYRPELADELPVVEREAQAAFERIDQALPGRAEPVNVMYITASEEEFTSLTQRSAERFLGVALARYHINKRGVTITSQSFYINGAAFQSDPSQDRQQTIAHELTHLVLSPTTMPYTPAWVSEGAAMFITNNFDRDVITDWYRRGGPASLDLFELTGKTSFGEADHAGEETTVEYAYSAYLAKYLADTYGQDTFLAFYDSFAAVPVEVIQSQLPRGEIVSVFSSSMSPIAQKVTPERVQAAFGVDLVTLEREFEEWLGQEVAR